MSKLLRFSIQTFRNSIGDLAAPDYGIWGEKEYPEHMQTTIAYLAWGAWLVSTFLNVIILLNFLIAVIS